ncbi:LytR family transcriptional regulator [Nocardioides sp. zg-579]|uniref:LytR family transcriptional regulator n=1 Tax=Nocardioides marmotae TaxID=2663857 RepID=A0A6I3JB86_9ACTN|nr:LytR family transcriptional regulator [Gordonia jinghuaiqii]MTB95387.1 LytR family transcriptional regulator [Nocardioides marmotae]
MTDVAERTHRRTVWRVVLVTQLCLALVTGIAVALVYRHVDRRIDEGAPISHAGGVERAEPRLPTSALNVVVLGTDERACEGCGIDREAGGGGADVTMLLHVADGRRAAYGISIPRDTLVDRPDCRVDGEVVPGVAGAAWNEALAVGGPACAVAQVEAVTGIYVDHYVVVDFGGFKEMVDAVDGVEVCIPEEIDDDEHNIHLDAGTQVLDGEDSLAYVRQRTSTPNADLGRMRRQQAFIASMVAKVLSARTLARPDRLVSFASAVAGSIQTDPELASVSEIVDLAASLRQGRLGKIRFVTAPVVELPRDDPNWGRVELTSEADELWRRVAADQPLGELGRGASSGRRPGGSRADAAANGLCS